MPRPVASRGPRDGFVDADGVRLHYVDWGEPGQPPVLFLHGGSAHARWWDFVVPHLADRYRCVALDLRGHGDSGWPATLDYRLAAHAADVAAVIEALDLRDVAVVGHSFGGFVAMVFAPGAGPRLSALVIVDSRVRISERSARFLDALRKLPHPRYATIEDATQRFRLLPAAHSAASGGAGARRAPRRAPGAGRHLDAQVRPPRHGRHSGAGSLARARRRALPDPRRPRRAQRDHLRGRAGRVPGRQPARGHGRDRRRAPPRHARSARGAGARARRVLRSHRSPRGWTTLPK